MCSSDLKPIQLVVPNAPGGAFDAAAARPEVDPERIMMWGLSFGSFWATQMAAAEPRFAALVRHEAPFASFEQLALMHDERFIKALINTVPTEGYVEIDGDTVLSPKSGEAALRAAGGLCAAVDDVVDREDHEEQGDRPEHPQQDVAHHGAIVPQPQAASGP